MLCEEENKESSNDQSKEKEAQEETKRQIGHYIIGKTIGEGTFGKVKLGTHILTGEKLAIKILEKDKIVDVIDVERAAREINILKIVLHPNICQLYEVIETPKLLYLIMEYASNGELFDFIVKNHRVKEKEACKLFWQLLNAIDYLHRLRIVHRDLKPENILLGQNKESKIIDFGLSNKWKNNELLKTTCGSPCYAAPEVISGKKYIGPKIDIWSCGVILFAMICGYLPFEDPNAAQLNKKILAGDYICPKYISKEAKDLISNILVLDPDKRFNIDQIRKHVWMLQIKQEYQPGTVVGIDQISVDMDVIYQLQHYHFNLEFAIKSVEQNKHNHVATTYHLLKRKQDKDVKRKSTFNTLQLKPYFSPQHLRQQKKKSTISDNLPFSPDLQSSLKFQLQSPQNNPKNQFYIEKFRDIKDLIQDIGDLTDLSQKRKILAQRSQEFQPQTNESKNIKLSQQRFFSTGAAQNYNKNAIGSDNDDYGLKTKKSQNVEELSNDNTSRKSPQTVRYRYVTKIIRKQQQSPQKIHKHPLIIQNQPVPPQLEGKNFRARAYVKVLEKINKRKETETDTQNQNTKSNIVAKAQKSIIPNKHKKVIQVLNRVINIHKKVF